MRACTKKERLAQVEAASKESRARIEGVQVGLLSSHSYRPPLLILFSLFSSPFFSPCTYFIPPLLLLSSLILLALLLQKKMAGLRSDDWRENMREKFKEREQEKEAEK